MVAMRARGTMAARVGAWRRLLVYAVLAFVAFAPIAKAACDFERLVPHGHFPGDAHASALAKVHVHASAHGEAHPHASAGADGMDNRCDRMSTAAVVAEARAVHIDSLTSPTIGFVVRVFRAPPLRVPNVLRGLHRTPPPEPVFRRLPKLLI